MGYVQIVHDVVGPFSKGAVVAEEHFTNIERLLGLGAVVAVDPRDVPADAVPPPTGASEEPATAEEPAAESAPVEEPAAEPAVEEPTTAPAQSTSATPATPIRPRRTP